MTAEQYFKDHGISQASIKKFDITYNKKKIIFPVKDEEGNVQFNKYRFLDFDKEDPRTQKFSYDEGAHAALFNGSVIATSKYVFLVEGEPDCIRLDQEGIAAISNTSGAGTFKEEWVELFEGKKVYVLYDNDRAGREGTQRILDLIPTAISITLPDQYNDICEYFAEHTKDEFRELFDLQIKANTITLEELHAVIDKWLLLPDKNVISIFLACLISHFFKSDPLWMFFVAPPSGSKTEIISTVIDLPFVKMLSNLTPQTLVSGMVTKKDASLLLQLKNHVLIMKDFTTVLSMRPDDKLNILSQLREVYDGRYSKAFGTGKTVEWEGRITLIAGVTPAIDTHYSMNQVMGERFIMYRVPQAKDIDVAEKALQMFGDETQMRLELKEAMSKYFQSIVIPEISEVELPKDILRSLAHLASFIVKARSQLIRDQWRRDLVDIPETEAPARLTKQLGVLIKALAVLNGRKKVSWLDYYLTLKVGLDIIPANRTKHLVALSDLTTLTLRTPEVAAKTKYSVPGSLNILEDLTALGITRCITGAPGSPTDWGISMQTYDYFKGILPVVTEDIHKIFTEESSYLPLINEMKKSGEKSTEEEVGDEAWTQTNSPF
jgi:5S rRNA maturation endonuclease (ribonuclease M5)